MKHSDVHHHILKILYKTNSAVLFFLGLYLTIRFEVENWNTRRIAALINNPMEVFVGVLAILGGFFFLYKYRHYNEERDED